MSSWWTTLDLQHSGFRAEQNLLLILVKSVTTQRIASGVGSCFLLLFSPWECVSPFLCTTILAPGTCRVVSSLYATLIGDTWGARRTAQEFDYSFLAQHWWTGVAASSLLLNTGMIFNLVQAIALCKTSTGETKWFIVNCHMDLTKALICSSFPAG